MEFFPLAMTFGGLVVFLDNESETSGLSFAFFLGKFNYKSYDNFISF
jgi:hypothetical protein